MALVVGVLATGAATVASASHQHGVAPSLTSAARVLAPPGGVLLASVDRASTVASPATGAKLVQVYAVPTSLPQTASYYQKRLHGAANVVGPSPPTSGEKLSANLILDGRQEVVHIHITNVASAKWPGIGLHVKPLPPNYPIYVVVATQTA